jgi:CRISPR type III-B/RAMP module RAMP protein Cmr6
MRIHPEHVTDFLETVGGVHLANLGLILEKFITWRQQYKGMVTVNRREYFDQLRTLFSEGKNILPEQSPDFLQSFAQRWQTMLSRAPFAVETFEAKTLWNLTLCKRPSELVGKVVGIYRNFPVPVINGTTIKGASRNYTEQYLLPEGELSQEEFEVLFGEDPASQEPSPGSLVFFNAIPMSGSYLTVDARTNQHTGFYSGNEERMARNDVVPIFFFSIPSGVPYLFALGSEEPESLARGVQIMKKALRKGGIGGATHVGYGYFSL